LRTLGVCQEDVCFTHSSNANRTRNAKNRYFSFSDERVQTLAVRAPSMTRLVPVDTENSSSTKNLSGGENCERIDELKRTGVVVGPQPAYHEAVVRREATGNSKSFSTR
jgi:hypothetical protein